ncbi:MAG TPA: ATP-binding protein [Acidobacteriaceae bacterium]
MNLQEFRRILKITLFLPLLLLLLLAVVLAWQIRRTLAEELLIDRSDRITAQLNDLQRLIVDQDSGLHGYELRQDSLSLGLFQTSNASVTNAFAGLAALVKGDPDQEMSTRRLHDSHAMWFRLAKQIQSTVNAASAGNRALLDLNEREAMNSLREQIRGMLQIEAVRRQQQRRVTATQVRMLMTVLLASAIMLGFFLGIFTQRNLKKVSQAFRASLDNANRRADELRESQQWLQTTLESMGDGLIASDRDGNVKFMNLVAQNLTGWNLSEAQGRPIASIFRILDDESRHSEQTLVGLTETAASLPGLGSHSVLQRKEGSELLIDHKASPILGASGEVTGTVLVFRDVTEQRRAEAALLANEKLAVAGRLAASIAHEIHNPLDAVANLHYLMERENDPAQLQRYLAMAQQELARTLQISRAMLGLYREPKVPVRVHLRELLESVLLLLESRFKNAAMGVERNLQIDARVEGFPGELRQVFANLITNAADAAGSQGRIRLQLEAVPSELNSPPGAAVTITDNGPGISEAVRDKLFQPFFTTKGENGTGLGLWVSRGIVEKHGGTLEVANSTDPELNGAQVRVYLPAFSTPALPNGIQLPVSHSD